VDLPVHSIARTLDCVINTRLEGRTALVTGSTDGIGSGIAQAFAAEGAHVIVTGRDAERGSELVSRIAARDGTANFVRADIAGGLDAARELANEATSRAGGHLDILVNNAALLIKPCPTAEVDESLLDQALTVNIKSVFLLTGYVAPAMAARGHGAIVNIGEPPPKPWRHGL
jgi:NAD(P)-dependent dehydrogenase (short-subunit alcohol dehydrogenase family)